MKADLGIIRYANKRILKEQNKGKSQRQATFLNDLKTDIENKTLNFRDKSNSVWSDRDIAILLYGVFRFGEGNWTQMLEGIEFSKTELSNIFL